MFDEISTWLTSGRNYAIGIQLYTKYGKDARLHNLFKENIITDFKQKKLKEALQELLYSTEQLVEKKEVVAEKYHTQYKQWPDDDNDRILAALRDEWRPVYAELSNLQARLHDVALAGNTDSNKRLEASQMAARIVKLDQQVREIYAQKSFYLKNGYLEAPKVTEEPIGPIELVYTRKMNLQRYLRDMKERMEGPNATAHKTAKWEERWNRYTDELRKLNKRLNKEENEGIPQRKASNNQ